MGANEYKWAQSSSNTTLLAKDVNSASFDSVRLNRTNHQIDMILGNIIPKLLHKIQGLIL
jgi:hypothetical protein